MNKCKKCLNSRWIISEDGYNPICCLSQQSAINCMTGKKNHFVTLNEDDIEQITNNLYEVNDND